MTRCDVERGPQLPVRRQVASDGNMKLGGAHVGDLRKENRVEIDPTKPEEDGNLSGTNLSGCLAYMYKSLFLSGLSWYPAALRVGFPALS